MSEPIAPPGTPTPAPPPPGPNNPPVVCVRKLGRKPARYDKRTLKLARYLAEPLPPSPLAVNWALDITEWGMMVNDQLGDCTIAGVGHHEQAWTANDGSEYTPSDATIISYYSQWDGYDPNNPSSDQGGDMLTVLTRWKNQGFDGHTIQGFASVDSSDQVEVKQAVFLFGGLYTGFNVPQSAMDQNAAGQVWDVVEKDGGCVGGHCVYIVGYNATGPVCVTWGALQQMTWAFWSQYFDEAYAVLGSDWYTFGTAPNGFNVIQLQEDIQLIH